MSHNDHGFAFPSGSGAESERYPGMTLRDWFAGHALVGMYLADEMARQAINPGGTRTTAEDFALSAYDQADAMLAARAPQAGGGGRG